MKNNYRDSKWNGKKFGKLTVIDYEIRKRGNSSSVYWIAKCDCGNIRSVNPLKLIKGYTKSCGCAKAERCAVMTEKYRVKHGGRNERLYGIWHSMKFRCYSNTSRDYGRYGGRGIKICDFWRDDYSSFRKWAYANGYSDDLTIERIDVNGDYEPSNCCWISMSDQAKNRRNCHLFEYNGVVMDLPDIAKKENVKYQTLYKWAVIKGLNIYDAVERCPRH